MVTRYKRKTRLTRQQKIDKQHDLLFGIACGVVFAFLGFFIFVNGTLISTGGSL